MRERCRQEGAVGLAHGDLSGQGFGVPFLGEDAAAERELFGLAPVAVAEAVGDGAGVSWVPGLVSFTLWLLRIGGVRPM